MKIFPVLILATSFCTNTNYAAGFDCSKAKNATKIFRLALMANSSAGYQQRHKLFLQILVVWRKWSMLDVFVVALLFVAVKLGALANITVHCIMV